MSKGDKRRPGTGYSEGWERIFGTDNRRDTSQNHNALRRNRGGSSRDVPGVASDAGNNTAFGRTKR